MQQAVHHQLLLCCANRTCCSLLRQLYELAAAHLGQQVTLWTDLGLLVHDVPQNVSHQSSMGHIDASMLFPAEGSLVRGYPTPHNQFV